MRDFKLSVTSVFSRVVRHHMLGAPPRVPASMPCGEAVGEMRERRSSCVVVTTSGGRPLGIITENDVVNRIAFVNDAATPVSEVMTSPVHTIHDDDYLFHGIAIMHRLGLRHLPVVQRGGRLVGLLHLHDALAAAVERVVDLIERLTHEETPEGLGLVKHAEVEVADALFNDQVPAAEIQSLITHINNDIYRRVISIVLEELSVEGWGGPPVEFDIIVMGSGGRGESFLYPDQDNGFVLADYPDSRHAAVDAYFIEAARRMCKMLGSVGFPECRGYVMALNPQWRKTLPQWRYQLAYWLERPDPVTLRYADIFFDFQHVFGKGELAGALRAHVSSAVRQNHIFLREMQGVQEGHGVALGMFGKLAPEEEGPQRGRIDLKYRGILPLVEAIRLLALREGVPETSTLGRIDALRAMGVLDRNEQDSLSNAFQNLTSLLLRQQIRDYKEGLRVGPYVSLDVLSSRGKDTLADSLRAISELSQRVRSELSGKVL